MVGPDMIRIRPIGRSLKAFQVLGHGDKIETRLLLVEREFRGGGTNWKFLGRRTAAREFGHADTMEWSESQTGIWIRTSGPMVIAVQANLSRLLTGNDHNGYVINTQAEIDTAIGKLWNVLDQISAGPALGDFTTIEIGGVVNIPLSTFEALLKGRNLPNAKKSPDLRPGESIIFGATKKSRQRIIFYDPERKRAWGHGRCTRVEVRLVGERLVGEHAQDQGKVKSATPVRELNLETLKAIFYRTIYRLDPGSTATVVPLADNEDSLAAMVLRCPACVLDGEHIFDRWARGKSLRQVRRVRRKADQVNTIAGRQTLRDLLPESPENPYVHLPNNSL